MERPTNKSQAKPATSVEKVDVSPNSPVLNLVTLMSSVPTNTPEAKLNETTISDGKGGQIYL